MVVDIILEGILLWVGLLVLPFTAFDLLWRMIPVYLNGFLASVYFPPSNTAAVFGGLTALWAGADWIRGYMMGQSLAYTSNWVIASIFIVYGIIGLVAGLRQMEQFYWVFGRRSILTYFAISFYPFQTGYVEFSWGMIIAIIIMAVPVIVLLELFASFARMHILKV